MTKRDRNEMDLPKAMTMTVENVIMPRPPSCIKVRIVSWPERVNCVPMSMTERPVTQTAEVAMNSASIIEIWLPSLIGNASNATVPDSIKKRKLNTG
jgi:hypothetical protein